MSCVEQCTSSVGIPVRLKGFTFCKPVGPRPKFPLRPRTPDDFKQQISIPQLSFENYLKNRGSKIIFLIIPNPAPVPLISSRTTWAPAIKIVKIPNPESRIRTFSLLIEAIFQGKEALLAGNPTFNRAEFSETEKFWGFGRRTWAQY